MKLFSIQGFGYIASIVIVSTLLAHAYGLSWQYLGGMLALIVAMITSPFTIEIKHERF